MADVKIGGGCSLGTVLFLIFLVLKLTGVIAWSWWWVTCPLWGSFAIVLAIIALALGCVVLAALFKK